MRFCRLQLRTTDVAGARAFYESVLGDAELEIVELPERARALGAPAHWLGQIGVDDLDASVAAFLERGASRLGPPGGEVAILRDPGGAGVALREGAPARMPDLAWFLLNTENVENAKATYGAVFGWTFFEPRALGDAGVFHELAWEPGGEPVGAMTGIEGRPGVHPHWLFYFRVAEMTAAVEAVRAGGGTVVHEMTLPTGAKIAVCDDPQGAAFAMMTGR